MRPQRSPDCSHPADEWCDRCTLTTSDLSLLRTVDGTAPDAHERQLCVNRRHSHGIWAYKDRCLRPGSPYPAAHRLTGAAALVVLVAVGAAAATAVRFARWLTG